MVFIAKTKKRNKRKVLDEQSRTYFVLYYYLFKLTLNLDTKLVHHF